MTESNDESRIPLPRREKRPQPAGHMWAWIVLAVAIVIFMALSLWMVMGGHNETQTGALSERDVIFRYGKKMSARWPQVPGPPEVYGAEANAALERGDLETAVRRTTMGLALDPDDANGWLRLIILSCQDPPLSISLSNREAQEVMVVVAHDVGTSDMLNIAMGWMALAVGDKERALASVGSQPEDFGGRWLRWKALGADSTPLDLDRVLEVAPGHTEACVARMKMAVTQGETGEAERIGRLCTDAGAEGEQVVAVLDTLDSPASP